MFGNISYIPKLIKSVIDARDEMLFLMLILLSAQ